MYEANALPLTPQQTAQNSTSLSTFPKIFTFRVYLVLVYFHIFLFLYIYIFKLLKFHIVLLLYFYDFIFLYFKIFIVLNFYISPPKHSIKKDDYELFFSILGNRFLAGIIITLSTSSGAQDLFL